MLSLEQIARIARLARIEVLPSEAQAMCDSLNGILGLVDQLCLVDCGEVEPMSHPQAVVQRLREDRVTEADQHELFQSVAPQVEDGLYLVPKVVE
jgi:aspartyl-tRNA(Asn)/glutamyl-tRNA(Gln) amidotransferase subunit C